MAGLVSAMQLWESKSMIVMKPEERAKYLMKEIKARIGLKNKLLCPINYKPENDERIAELEQEILEICDEIEELEEAADKGRELVR